MESGEVKKPPRGFALIEKDKLRAICSAAGKKAHAIGKGHQFTREEASAAGKRGGLAISSRPGHMKELGRRGGIAASSKPGFMSQIGKLSWSTRRRPSNPDSE